MPIVQKNPLGVVRQEIFYTSGEKIFPHVPSKLHNLPRFQRFAKNTCIQADFAVNFIC